MLLLLILRFGQLETSLTIRTAFSDQRGDAGQYEIIGVFVVLR